MAPDLPSEASRRRLVALVFAFYLALLGEGVLRKWVLPGASNALVFIRDPLELAIAVLAWRQSATLAIRRAWAALGFASLLLVLCAACQALTTAMPALVLLFGFRNYLLFVPLALAIGSAFRPDDYLRWLRLNLWIAPPIAALVVGQYRAPPSHWLNAVPGGTHDGVFMLVEDVVRPYGLFSFTLGHSAFAAWMTGVVLAAASLPRGLVSRPLLLIGGASVVVMGLFSGSRTYFLFAGADIAIYLATAMVFGAPRDRTRSMVALALLGLLAGLVLLLAPSVIGNILDRQSTAVAAEGSTLDRIVVVASQFTSELTTSPLFGRGIGAGTNVANYLAHGSTDRSLAEYELTRVVQELGPVFGLAYIALRWGTLGGLALLTVASARRGNLQPACFLGFLAPIFLAHDITLQNTMIAIAWFAVGILLAAARLPATAPRRSVQPVLFPLRSAACG